MKPQRTNDLPEDERMIREAWQTYRVIRDPNETPEEVFKNGARAGIQVGIELANKETQSTAFERQ